MSGGTLKYRGFAAFSCLLALLASVLVFIESPSAAHAVVEHSVMQPAALDSYSETDSPGSSSVSGVVTSTGGTSLAGIQVSLFSAALSSPQSWANPGASVATAYTDILGSYSLPSIQPGDYVIRFSQNAYPASLAPQWWPAQDKFESSTVLTVVADKSWTGINAVMKSSTSTASGGLTGLVTDDAGNPLAGVRVSPLPKSGGPYGYSQVTDSSGRYNFTGMAPGLYSIKFGTFGLNYISEYYENARAGTATSVEVLSGQVTSLNTAILATGATVSGRLVGTSGNPIVGLTVLLVEPSTGNTWNVGEPTNSNGEFSGGGFAPGTYTLRFVNSATFGAFVDGEGGFGAQTFGGPPITEQWWSGKATLSEATTFSLSEGEILSGLNATLSPGSVISGTVTNKNGQSVSDIAIEAYPVATDGSLPEYSSYWATTDSSGTYSLNGLPPGSYRLKFSDPSRTYSSTWLDSTSANSSRTVAIASAQSRTGINVTMQSSPATYPISGQVTDSAGQPVQGVTIEAYDRAGNRVTPAGIFNYQTDLGGNYTLSGLPAGEYTLKAAPSAYNWMTSHLGPGWLGGSATFPGAQFFKLSSSTTNTGKNIQLSAGAVIAGATTMMTDSGLVAAPNTHVWLTSVDGSMQRSVYSSRTGTYTFGGVEPGQYRVRFTGTSDQLTQWWGGAQNESDAEIVTVPFQGQLTGIDGTLISSAGTISRVSAPVISGNLQVGSTVTVSGSTWNPSEVSLLYEWQNSGVLTTSNSYTVATADVGDRISVVIYARKDGYKEGVTYVLSNGFVASGVANSFFTTTTIPTISGTVTVGSTLQATIAAWTPVASSSTYQWLRDGVAIAGATTSSYQLTADDLGAAIRVSLTGIKPGYWPETTTSSATPVVATGAISPAPTPVIAGSRKINQQLVVDPGTWASGTTLSYQWRKNGANIPGATGLTYTPSQSDYGQTISVAVIGSKPGYISREVVSLGAAILAGDLSLVPVPTVSGTFVVGQTLTAVPGTWDSGVSLSYQWNRNGTAISGAVQSTYVLTSADQGQSISVGVRGTKSGYISVVSTSVGQGVGLGTLTLTPTPSFTGATTVGTTLAGVPGTWDTGVTKSYQWLRDGVPIAGATASTYAVKSGDLGGVVTFQVTGSKAGFASVVRTSSNSSAVTLPGMLTDTPTSNISGTVTSTTGTQLASIQVSLFSANQSGQSWQYPGVAAYTTTTDIYGRYSFTNVASGDYVVRFSQNAYPVTFDSQWWVGTAAFDQSNVLTVSAGKSWTGINAILAAVPNPGAITGLVTSTAGQALAGVQVYLSPKTPGVMGYSQTTDASGRYTFGKVVPGQYLLRVMPTGMNYLSEYYNDKQTYATATAITVTSGASSTLTTVALAPGAAVSGRLVDTLGNPVVGVQVILVEPSTGNSWRVGQPTSSTGNYSGAGFATGTYTLKFSNCADWSVFIDGDGGGGGSGCSGPPIAEQWWNGATSLGTATTFALTSGQAKTGMNATVSPGASISGIVTSSQGQSVADISVEAFPALADGAVTDYSRYSTVTDTSGAYTLVGLPAGSYRLKFTDWSSSYSTTWLDSTSGGTSRTVTVAATQARNNVNAMMPSVYSVGGQVTNASGLPLSGVKVIAFDRAGNVAGSQWSSTNYSNSTGNFTISGLPSGEYTLKSFPATYESPSYLLAPTWFGGAQSFTDAQFFSVNGTSTNVAKNITMEQGSSITGVVRAETDAGIVSAANAEVQLKSLDGSYVKTIYSGRTGAFSFQGVNPGQYKVRFSGSAPQTVIWWGGQSEDSATVITVAPQTSTTGIDGTLRSSLGQLATSITPVITGDLAVGSTVTATSAGWAPNDVTLHYEWQYNGVRSSSNTYVIKPMDAGQRIFLIVYATKDGYTEGYKTAVTTGIVPTSSTQSFFASTSTPSISGAPQVGLTLTATSPAWSPVATTTSYQWLRDGAPIVGATSQTYQLRGADSGTSVRVAVTGSKDGYWTETRISSGTAPVQSETFVSTPVPTISASLRVGEVVSATNTAWDSDVSLSYQWLRAGVPIPGATSNAYTVVNADAGQKISVEVTGVKPFGSNQTRKSLDSDIVNGGTLTVSAQPTISGLPVVGQFLTASEGTWTPGTSLTYQWKLDGIDIPGATTLWYAANNNDAGGILSLHVTGTKEGFEPLTVSAVMTSIVTGGTFYQRPTPVVTGGNLVGQTLTVNPGAWPTGTTFTYQWIRNGTVLSGATSSTYELTNVDAGTSITAQIIASKPGYNSVTLGTGSLVFVSGGTMANTSPVVSISGISSVSNYLTSTVGTWDTGVTLAYQWMRGASPISGATNANYLLATADVGYQISLKITGSKSGFNQVISTSGTIGPIGFPQSLTPTPTIAGTAVVGNQLSMTSGTWDTGVTKSYQWKRNGLAIAGATGSTYTLTPSDFDTRITVSVTGTRANYTTVMKTSAATSWVGAGTFVSSPSPTISGSPTVGQTLAAVPGSWDAGASLTYQWMRDAIAISGATGATYLVDVSDRDSTIQVVVTATSSGYLTTTRLSAPGVKIAMPLTLTPTPVMTGTSMIGSTLSISPGTWDSGVTLTYSWGRLFNGYIVGATTPNYSVAATDKGYAIGACVTGTKAGYTPVTKCAWSSQIKGLPLAPTPSTSITYVGLGWTAGPSVGQVLSVSLGNWQSTSATFAYQWYRDGEVVPGILGTSPTLTLTQADAGHSFSVKVTGSNLGYYETTSVTTTETNMVLGGAFTTMSRPTISGTLTVGETLTADPGAWDAGTTFTYTWLRNGSVMQAYAPLASQTQQSYVLVPADAGQQISVKITATKPGFTPTSTTSFLTTAISPATQILTPTVSIQGSAEIGRTLTAAPGTWDSGVTVAYQWNRAGFAISGATSPTYVLENLDAGKSITVTVTGSALGYKTKTVTSSPTASVIASEMTLNPVPLISGPLQVGSTLTAVTGTWDAGTQLSYQWYKSGIAIPGATAATYLIANVDAGETISLQVTGSKVGYLSISRSSMPSNMVTGGILTGATPVISGSTLVNQTLKATAGTWDAGVALTYRWLRNGNTIGGASTSSYTLTEPDAGATITVVVTGTKAGFNSLEKISLATTAISLNTLALTPVPTLTGTTKVGYSLTATPGTWTAGTTLTYAWYRDGQEISGATTPSRTLTNADAGTIISVKVTGQRYGYEIVTKEKAMSTIVTNGTLIAGDVGISGTPQVGSTLSATASGWPSGVGLSYSWRRNSTVIAGANSASYVVSQSDAGSLISVQVVGNKTGFNAASTTSSPTAMVTGGQFALAPNPIISGNLFVGETLQANAGLWDAGTSFSYQWRRDGSDIVGATSQAYLLTAEDVGASLTVVSSATKSGYTPTARVSNPTPLIDFSSFTLTRVQQAPFWLAVASTSGLVGTPIALSSAGGSGTGAITYTVTSGVNICSVVGSTLIATGAGTCGVTPKKQADNSYFERAGLEVMFSFLKAQLPIVINTQSSTALTGADIPLSYIGGSGGGLVTHSLVSGAAGCSVVGNVLSSTTAGTCSVTISKSGDGYFASTTANTVTFTFIDSGRRGKITVSGVLTYRGEPVTSGLVKLDNCSVRGTSISASAQITSSSNGRYSLDVIPGCAGKLTFQAMEVDSRTLEFGYYALDNAFVAPLLDVTVDYELPSLVPVSVSVVDSSGSALADVYVAPDRTGSVWPTLFSQASDGTPISGSYTVAQSKGCTTNSSGTCTTYVPANSTTVFKSLRTVSGSSVAAVGPTVVVTSAAASAAITFPDVGRNVTISGVMTYQGAPVTSGQVKLDNCVVNGLAPVSKTVTIDRNSNGRYSFDVPAGCVGKLGFYSSWVNSANLQFGYYALDNAFVAPLLDVTVDYELPSLVPVSVSVVDSSGSALADVYVAPDRTGSVWPTLFSQASDGTPISGSYTVAQSKGCTTNSSGTCTTYVPANSTTVFKSLRTVSGSSVAAVGPTVVVTSAAASAAITFPDVGRNVTISGVMTYQGAPVTSGQVKLDNCVVNGLAPVSKTVTIDRNSNGRYSFDVPAGCVGQLSFSATRVESLGLTFLFNSVPQTFVSPATASAIDFGLPAMVPLTVALKDANGTPLNGVTLSPQVAGSSWPDITSTLSDGSSITGSFVVVPAAGCNVIDSGECTMYVPANSTTVIKSWAKVRGVSTNIDTSTFTVADLAATGSISISAMSTVEGSGLAPKQVVLNSTEGFVISDVRADSVAQDVLPANSTDLTGAISYTVTGMDVGASASMTIALPEGSRPNLAYKQINGVLTDVTSIATFEGNSVTIRVVDGGLGDEDGIANGQVVDPIVIAQVPVAQSTLTVTTSATSATLGSAIVVGTTGGDGTGAVSYQVSGAGCSLNSNQVSSTQVGSCSITAIKASDANYLSATSAAVSVNFSAPAPQGPVENLNTTNGRNRNFVRMLYRDFLNTTASEGEIAYWAAELDSGRQSQASLTTTLSRSDAWIQSVIRGFYVDTLGREPDAAGYAYWINQARNGKPIADIGSFFYGSDEYFQSTGQNNHSVWIGDLYQKLMLRPGDAGGIDYWVGRLNAGMSRPAVSHWFYQSPEKRGLRVDYLYSKLLNRGSDPGGRAYWAERLYAEGDLALASQLASSPEYFGRAFYR